MTKRTTKQKNLQEIGEQLAALEENPSTPSQISEGIREHLAELASVVSLWNPRVLRAVYWILAEEAELAGIDLTEGNYIGQDIRNNPHEYESARPN